MNRRDFLTRSSMIISGAALGGGAGLFPQETFAKDILSDEFSIDIVTGHPNQAIRKVEQVIQNAEFHHLPVRFTEYQLHGSHIGDIAYVQSQQLIHFRTATDDVSQQLRETATALSLPNRYDNPILLRFYAGNPSLVPTDATVFCGDVLVKQLPLNRTKEVYRIEGVRGHVDVAVAHRSVKIVSASCKHKTCMNMGAIDQPGQSLVCIPNQISVAIAGTNSLGVDGVSY